MDAPRRLYKYYRCDNCPDGEPGHYAQMSVPEVVGWLQKQGPRMTSLRMRVVEAVAEELEADCNAEAVLDAMLDCLTENADEWVALNAAPREEWDNPKSYDSMIRAMSQRERRLLAVLGNPE